MRATGKIMTQEARSAAPSRKKITVAAAKQDGRARAANEAAVQHYQAAVQLLQQGKFEKALGLLEKLLPEAPVELQDRCRMYISTCRRQMEKGSLSFLTPEELRLRHLAAEYRLLRGSARAVRKHSDWTPRR